jgi:hypothetical protein
MARSRSDLDNEMDHEIRRLTFPTSRRLAARSGIEPNLDAQAHRRTQVYSASPNDATKATAPPNLFAQAQPQALAM